MSQNRVGILRDPVRVHEPLRLLNGNVTGELESLVIPPSLNPNRTASHVDDRAIPRPRHHPLRPTSATSGRRSARPEEATTRNRRKPLAETHIRKLDDGLSPMSQWRRRCVGNFSLVVPSTEIDGESVVRATNEAVDLVGCHRSALHLKTAHRRFREAIDIAAVRGDEIPLRRNVECDGLANLCSEPASQKTSANDFVAEIVLKEVVVTSVLVQDEMTDVVEQRSNLSSGVESGLLSEMRALQTMLKLSD